MSRITGLSSITGLGSFVNQGIAPDVTPNAVNWADVSDVGTATTTMQQFTGINQTITIAVDWGLDGDFYYSKNTTNSYDAATQVQIITSPQSITISNGDYLGFRLVQDGRLDNYNNVEVKNSSDGNATLDTFIIEALA